ncbi:polysaccharide pyruvyl transferase family protein [Modestobacter sp. I12A-02628]|uniref:Polysaccharide pyruvyl transferase family protein n=1 Tax=Goekera deserti TaxID=2497753 RepID=A0A7K3W7R0_9ACTN|nr:polysaccharide pyruvyl transferase family protein [Goekera deserti]MPQ99869.1 polysaccharide pyruvyl transferase family protein [Goekera deserti]NDI50028.1 polysaccharide pyruvyl transferase family protein [Goekera deserti]NEL52495.1 polysaccharide pyruvyl transferase family protein [Goekera deserti]
MRVLVAGWFSFDEVIATVGDELGADVVVRWLAQAGVAHDVAWAPYLGRGVDWRDVDPAAYTHLVFVSGPVSDTPLLRELTETFAAARRWAVNVSVVSPAGRALFDEVWERDAPGVARPDLAIGTTTADLPVLAVAFTPPQEEYGGRSRAEQVRGALEEWLAMRALPWFELTMDLFEKPHARHPAQVEALIRRADVVVSMRLHALVLGLAHGRPVVACDAIAGGAKVTAQARALGWPLLLGPDDVTPAGLDDALAQALSGRLGAAVPAALQRGLAANETAHAWFAARLTGG